MKKPTISTLGYVNSPRYTWSHVGWLALVILVIVAALMNPEDGRTGLLAVAGVAMMVAGTRMVHLSSRARRDPIEDLGCLMLGCHLLLGGFISILVS